MKTGSKSPDLESTNVSSIFIVNFIIINVDSFDLSWFDLMTQIIFPPNFQFYYKSSTNL